MSASLRRLWMTCLVLLSGTFALAASAHTTIESAKPASGAELDRSPSSIELKFKHPMQMTSVVVIDAGKTERKLSFSPTTGAQVITIATPALEPGRSEIKWKGLSKDGHVISGSLSYVIKPASP